MSVGDDLRDSATRHSVFNLRYARTTYRKHLKIIDEAVADITNKLAVRAPGSGLLTRARMEAVLKDIKKSSVLLYEGLRSGTDESLKALAEYESRIQLQMIDDAYPIELSLTKVTPNAIHAAATAQPFRGKILRDWWKDQEYSVGRAFKAAVKLGFVQGESIPQITQRVRGIGNMTRRQVEAVVRTAVRHTSQVAMTEISKANADVIEAEEYVATLDGRTTAICQSLDGNRYPIESGPRPPVHFNCRSVRVPVPAEWATLFGKADPNSKLNDRPFVADKRRVKDIPKKDRDKIIGSTKAKTYNDWLKTQKKSFVVDVLGKKKADLYLDGGVSLDRFVDRNGRSYTLPELEKREKRAFNNISGN